LNLHKHLTKIGKTLSFIDSKKAKLKQALKQEQNNWKVVEQTLALIENLFISTKRKVEQLEGQNESLTKMVQTQQLEL
jgi:hypothetical protein